MSFLMGMLCFELSYESMYMVDLEYCSMLYEHMWHYMGRYRFSSIVGIPFVLSHNMCVDITRA